MKTDTRHDEPRTLAVPRRQEIGDVTFFLDRDGRLTIDERPYRQPLVKLTLSEAFALLTFVRLPGVAELIEQAEAARQEQQWWDYEPDPETIAERVSGR